MRTNEILEQHPTSIQLWLLFPFPFWPGGGFPVPLCWGKVRKQEVNNNNSTTPEITVTSREMGELEASSIQAWLIPKKRKEHHSGAVVGQSSSF